MEVFFQQQRGHVPISFFGTPFSVESISIRHCVLGPKYYPKREPAVPDHLLDHVIPKKKRLRVSDTKKSDCPAVLYIKCVRVYPGYAIQSATAKRDAKAMVLRRLRKDLELPYKPDNYLRYYMVASPASQHTHPTESVEAKGDIHPLLVQEIQNLVQDGMTSVKDIKVVLEQLVNDFFADSLTPGRNNTTFYPSNKTIYSHVYRALHIKKPVVYRSILKNQKSSHEINSDEEMEVYHIVDTSDSYSQEPEARDHVSGTSNSYSQELEAREHVPETSNSYSQQLKARELCEQVSNLTYNCSNSTALQEVLELLRECVKKLHSTNAEVGNPAAVASTSRQ